MAAAPKPAPTGPSAAETALLEQQSQLAAAQEAALALQSSEIEKAQEIASRERVDEVQKGLQKDTDRLVRLFGAKSSMAGGNLRAPIFGA